MNLIDQYLELLKKTLINEIYIENEAKIFYLVKSALENTDLNYEYLIYPENMTLLLANLAKAKNQGASLKMVMKDQNGKAMDSEHLRNVLEFPHSMIGRKRMDHLQSCIETLIAEDIPGDLIETGVWRGGATIFMKGVLRAYHIKDRKVWVADSFQGLPPPNYQQDQGIDLSEKYFPVLAVSLEKVKDLFQRYDLLDEQVHFLKGWFKDTLPDAPIEQLAILRLDGDLYESTWDSLTHLYHKVSTGGFIIIDDYNALDVCREAVHNFRAEQGIHDELITIDDVSVYWRKST